MRAAMTGGTVFRSAAHTTMRLTRSCLASIPRRWHSGRAQACLRQTSGWVALACSPSAIDLILTRCGGDGKRH